MSKRQSNADDLGLRRNIRQGLGSIAKEMGYAVNSIRQEVVEKPWFGEAVTPEVVQEWDRDVRDNYSLDEKQAEGPQDFSNDNDKAKEFEREDLYGKDPLQGRDPSEFDPDIEDGREHMREWDRDEIER